MFSAPFYVTLQLTNMCNLACIHCFATSFTQYTDPILSLNEITDLMDELDDIKIFRLILSGGEPLIRKDFFKIAEYASNKNFSIVLATNGTLISDRDAKKLANLNFEKIAVSLDGATPKTNDTFRGVNGAYQKTVTGIKFLAKYDVKVFVDITVSKYNFNEISEIIEKSVELGASGVHLLRLLPAGRGIILSQLLSLTPMQSKELMHVVSKLNERYKGKLEIRSADFCYREEQATAPKGLEEYAKGCAGKYLVVISPSGDIFPCDMLVDEAFHAGNIRRKSFQEIWKKSDVLNELRRISIRDIKGRCNKCKFKSTCFGGCRANAWNIYGDLYMSDPLCPKFKTETKVI